MYFYECKNISIDLLLLFQSIVSFLLLKRGRKRDTLKGAIWMGGGVKIAPFLDGKYGEAVGSNWPPS